MPEIASSFHKPFAEQVAAFRLRLGNLVPTARWDDLWQDQFDRAFMVAGATKADLLADLAAAVDRSIEQGTGLEAFRKDFREIVARHGWTGWTGEGSKKGEAWRTRVIYRTNMATTYAAGRMAQLREKGYPLWIYRHGGSREPRPQHLDWDGLILEADHPFWITHAPPNGWGCSCYVIGSRTKSAARRRGGDPDKALPDDWRDIDEKTGAPVGIDRGWAYAPGRSIAEGIAAAARKSEDLPPDLAKEWLLALVRHRSFENWLKKPDGNWPLVRLPDSDAEELGSDVAVAVMSPQTAEKQLRVHPEMTAAEYEAAQRVVDGHTHRILDAKVDAKSMIYIRVEDPGPHGGHILVVKATRTGKGLFVTSFRRLSRDAALRDREIVRLLRKAEKK